MGAACLGGAEAALESMCKYAAGRQQFGKPIAEKQMIQWMIADTASEVEALRSMVYRTAWMVDTNQPYTKEAGICKLFGSEVAARAINRAVQVHGALGYYRDFPDRAQLARRAHRGDLRGHERDPAHRHRRADAAAVRRAGAASKGGRTMRIIVCMKQGVDPQTVKISRSREELDLREARHAHAAGRQILRWRRRCELKDAEGAEVIAVVVGGRSAEDTAREAVAMGADKAVLILQKGQLTGRARDRADPGRASSDWAARTSSSPAGRATWTSSVRLPAGWPPRSAGRC